jgi:high affinity Mn2+ porin
MIERGFLERNVSSILQRATMIAVILAWFSLAVLCSVAAQAQSTPEIPAQTKSDYDKGYEAGYEAGLRAAAAKSTGQSTGQNTANAGASAGQNAVPDEPPNTTKVADEPPQTPVTTTADNSSAENQNLTPKMKSIWADMTSHDDQDQDTFFHHSQTAPYWISAQANFIGQMHPRFHADYSGTNSFYHAEEQSMSRVITLFTGFQLDDTTEFVLDAESTGWSGLSQALGLGAYVNLDAVRNPELSAEPYLARLWLRKVIPLSDESVEMERDPLSMLTSLPARRIDIHVGKMTLPDFFDINSIGSDSHMQFMNWAVDNNPAWDYAADTRGYTYGIVIDYEDRHWGVRFAEALEPTVANGDTLEWNPKLAHSENYEAEYRPQIIPNRFTAIRLLYYMNWANMGNYNQAISSFEQEKAEGKNVSVPNIDDHTPVLSLKYGFGLNMEQEITDKLRFYSRLGWNEGQHESWAYTECDESFTFGGDLRGDWWGRPQDKFGVAFVEDGLSANHRRYLSLGGLGFILGDGNISYGAEQVMESYYNFPIPIERGVFGAFDVQYINNPGYNRARGPVVVPGVRLHLEL